MANNKVQLADGTTLIDLTEDTVTADDLLLGVTAHDKSGSRITGTRRQVSIEGPYVTYENISAGTSSGLHPIVLDKGLYLIQVAIQPRINPPSEGISLAIAMAISDDNYINGSYQMFWQLMQSGWKTGQYMFPLEITSDDVTVKWQVQCSVACELRFSTTVVYL